MPIMVPYRAKQDGKIEDEAFDLMLQSPMKKEIELIQKSLGEAGWETSPIEEHPGRAFQSLYSSTYVSYARRTR